MNPTWKEYTFQSNAFPCYFDLTNRSQPELVQRIRDNAPPHVGSFGDGEVLCCLGWLERTNRDGQEYSPALAEALADALRVFTQTPDLWLRNWAWWPLAVWIHGLCEMWGGQSEWCGYDVFQHFDGRPNTVVRDLYLAIRENPRRKVLIGPDILRRAVAFVRAEAFVSVPQVNGWRDFARVRAETLNTVQPGDLVLVVYGPSSKPLMAEMIKACPDARCLDVGAGVDPIVGRKTREHHPDPPAMRALYGDMLDGILQCV